jgi:hypothetical protein
MVSPSGSLPRWVTTSTTSSLKQSGTTFVCPLLGSVFLESATFTIDGSYYLYSLCTCDKGTYGTPPDCPSIPTEVPLPAPWVNSSSGMVLDWSQANALYTSFTDAAYGHERVIGGMDTSFLINSTSLLLSTGEYRINRPVLGITIHLWLTTDFAAFTDVLSIYEGGTDLKGTRVATYRGSDFVGTGNHSLLVSLCTIANNISCRCFDMMNSC